MMTMKKKICDDVERGDDDDVERDGGDGDGDDVDVDVEGDDEGDEGEAEKEKKGPAPKLGDWWEGARSRFESRLEAGAHANAFAFERLVLVTATANGWSFEQLPFKQERRVDWLRRLVNTVANFNTPGRLAPRFK
jgi:hypothetical protein